jgi:predicted acylesterase/phospholipase RssA
VEAARAAVASRADSAGGWQVSDIIDAAGHQYVDLVMEGGGVLGIALVGYVHVLEELGIRFLQLGGTSAGSLNALLMGAAGPVQAAKTEWLLEQLAPQNLQDFVDGDARDFVQVLVNNGRLRRYLWRRYLWKGAQVVDNLTKDFGLNPGDVFHDWLRRLRAERGVRTVRDLNQLRTLTAAAGLVRRDGSIYAPKAATRVALVTADVTTESKVIFPEMAHLYYQAPEEVNPADFVRASMAIPGFFRPFQVDDLLGAGLLYLISPCHGYRLCNPPTRSEPALSAGAGPQRASPPAQAGPAGGRTPGYGPTAGGLAPSAGRAAGHARGGYSMAFHGLSVKKGSFGAGVATVCGAVQHPASPPKQHHAYPPQPIWRRAARCMP